MNSDALLADWALWMRAGHLSERTIADRIITTSAVLATGIDATSCGWHPLAEFLARPDLSHATRHTYRAQLRSFFGWLQAVGLRADDPTAILPRIRTPKHRPRPITTEQLTATLAACARPRTRTMILLAAYQGLRIHEIAKFRGEDIQVDELRVVGKGETDILLPLHELIAAEARTYPREGWWFPSPDDPNRPVTSRNVGKVIATTMRRAGIDGETAHMARHWYGTQVLRSAGGNVRVAQELLRHAMLATTAIYTEVLAAEQRAAIDQLPRA